MSVELLEPLPSIVIVWQENPQVFVFYVIEILASRR